MSAKFLPAAVVLLAGLLASAPAAFAAQCAEAYPLLVLPDESARMKDPETGTELLFLTSGESENQNLYFHQRSWLSDDSMILFAAGGEHPGLTGYLTATGERVLITTAAGEAVGGATAAALHPAVFAMAGNRVYEFTFRMELSERPDKRPSKVTACQRLVGEFPPCIGQVNESCDGRFLATGGADPAAPGKSAVFTMDTATGEVRTVCDMPPGTTLGVSHVQWSVTNPHWISFANAPVRLWVVDIRDGKPWAPYVERPGELVTHESWWVNDQMLFCGGVHEKPLEDSHVKTLDPRTGEVRIVGEGMWMPGVDAKTLARRNWWHASGSPDGRWVAGDNWHGDIMLFEGLTARPRLLTTNHRTYGKGRHPEVGWDRHGKQVVFGGSYKLGKGAHVCVATIPGEWQREADALGRRVEAVEAAAAK